MEVSRVTLRKALALLREDGLISNIRGKGNFVTSPEGIDKSFQYKKKIQHPFYACCRVEVDSIEVNFKIEPPCEAILKVLKQDTAVVIICERWYKHDGNAIGYSRTFIPIEIITQFKVNLNRPKEIETFVESLAYTQTIKANTVLKFTTDGNTASNKYKISDEDTFIILYENLYSKENNIMMHTRYYVPTEHFKVHINLNDKYEF